MAPSAACVFDEALLGPSMALLRAATTWLSGVVIGQVCAASGPALCHEQANNEADRCLKHTLSSEYSSPILN